MFSAKQYVQVAGVILEHKDKGAPEVARALAGMFQRDNPRFDRRRFLDACDVADHVDGWEVRRDTEPEEVCPVCGQPDPFGSCPHIPE
jgi:hypothetical protein